MTSDSIKGDPDCQHEAFSITGIKQSLLSPAYLHTNSTSHVWPFSAIAELIDNAYDPDVNASQLKIDFETINSIPCLTFLDNGSGVSPYSLYKMLSFGFCDKDKYAVTRHKPVGHYGNGFKSGSMRLGKDALVLTKHGSGKDCIASIGLLSQSYLNAVKSETILVPTVNFAFNTHKIIETPDSRPSLLSIIQHSVLNSKKQILQMINDKIKETGTYIIIYNLRTNDKHDLEFDFVSDLTDIRIVEDDESKFESLYAKEDRINTNPTTHYSLRAYCSILFLRPKMQIFVRGTKVKSKLLKKSLSRTLVDVYKPQGIEKPCKITFGFNSESDNYGIMMYYRNRLIRSYVRVGYQLKPNSMGTGVVGIIECNYLTPTHNKQDFEYNKQYRTTMFALAMKLNDYWNENCGDLEADKFSSTLTEFVPDQLWVQCDNKACLKWRKLPANVASEDLPDKWYCKDNTDPDFADCSAPEERDANEEYAVPYVKTFKNKRRKLKSSESRRIAESILERQTLAQQMAQNTRSNNVPMPLFTVGQSTASPRPTTSAHRAPPGVKLTPPTPVFRRSTEEDDDITIISDSSVSPRPNKRATEIKPAAASSVRRSMGHFTPSPLLNGGRPLTALTPTLADIKTTPVTPTPNSSTPGLFLVNGPDTINEMNLTSPEDKTVVMKLTKLHPKTRWNLLVNRTLQLRDLRTQVCSLLHMLVPELDQSALGVVSESIDGKKLPSLLSQVLEANQARDGSNNANGTTTTTSSTREVAKPELSEAKFEIIPEMKQERKPESKPESKSDNKIESKREVKPNSKVLIKPTKEKTVFIID